MTREYFFVAHSNAAPFFSDTTNGFVLAQNETDAIARAKKKYSHPAGLYAMAIYGDANAFHKGEKPMVTWLSPRAETAK